MEEYAGRILKVLVYIEEHLDEELNIETLSRVACYSPFHLHRIFQGIVGETVHQYAKRLKLERAASRLRYRDDPVTEIAMDSYDTPSSFTKAFKQQMGMSPQRYRSLHNIVIKKIEEIPMIKPETIEKKLPFLPLLFIRRVGSYHESPMEAWKAMWSFIHEQKINPEKLRYFGISHDNPEVTEAVKLRYDAAIWSPSKIKIQGEVGEQILKGGKYAIFHHHGSYEGLKDTFNQIFLKWLPQTKEGFDETRTIFTEYFYLEHRESAPEKLLTKIHIPLL